MLSAALEVNLSLCLGLSHPPLQYHIALKAGCPAETPESLLRILIPRPFPQTV